MYYQEIFWHKFWSLEICQKTCSSKLTLDVSKCFREIICGHEGKQTNAKLWLQQLEIARFACENRNFERLKIYISAINPKFITWEKLELFIYIHTLRPVLTPLHSRISNIFACTAVTEWDLLHFLYYSLLELGANSDRQTSPLVSCGNFGFWVKGIMFTVSILRTLSFVKG